MVRIAPLADRPLPATPLRSVRIAAGAMAQPVAETGIPSTALSIGWVAIRVEGEGAGRGRRGQSRRGGVVSEPIVLLGGLGIPESPRWHNGRLWFCNWIDQQIV